MDQNNTTYDFNGAGQLRGHVDWVTAIITSQ